jgi:predicted O-methyltransferase YrrM
MKGGSGKPVGRVYEDAANEHARFKRLRVAKKVGKTVPVSLPFPPTSGYSVTMSVEDDNSQPEGQTELPGDQLQRDRLRDLERQLRDLEWHLSERKAVMRRLRMFACLPTKVALFVLSAHQRIRKLQSPLRAQDLVGQITEREADVEGRSGLVATTEDVVSDLRGEIEKVRQLDAIERSLFDGQPLTNLARSYWRDPWWPELRMIRRISMLHPETLYLLRHFAGRIKNPAVEVGPYIGGSTIAIGRGLQLSGGGPLISVEMGGSHPTKDVPTQDIFTDLKRNLQAYGLTGLVHIMQGFSTDPKVDAMVNRILDGRPIDLLFLDADGNVGRDFEHYRRRLSRDAILVYDDYVRWELGAGAPEKQTTIKAWVDASVASGLVEDFGVYRWGAWVGRYRG